MSSFDLTRRARRNVRLAGALTVSISVFSLLVLLAPASISVAGAAALALFAAVLDFLAGPALGRCLLRLVPDQELPEEAPAWRPEPELRRTERPLARREPVLLGERED